jgi:hypothetical protein
MENNNDKKTKEEVMAGKYLDPKAGQLISRNVNFC